MVKKGPRGAIQKLTGQQVTVSNIPAKVRTAYGDYDRLLAKKQSGKKLSTAEQTRLHDTGTATLKFEQSIGYSRLKNKGKRYNQK